MSENGEIYTAWKNFTLPPALTALTNSTSGVVIVITLRANMKLKSIYWGQLQKTSVWIFSISWLPSIRIVFLLLIMNTGKINSVLFIIWIFTHTKIKIKHLLYGCVSRVRRLLLLLLFVDSWDEWWAGRCLSRWKQSTRALCLSTPANTPTQSQK